MTIWEDLAKALGGNVQYSYPNGQNPMAARGLAAFAPAPMGGDVPVGAAPPIMPVNVNPLPEKSALSSFAPQPETQQPQSQIPAPYNMLERAFLGFGGQGAAVDEDKKRYQLAKLAESLPIDPNDKIGNSLRQFAMQSPDGAETYLKYVLEKSKKELPNTTGLPEGQMWVKGANGYEAAPIPGAKIADKPYSEIAKLKADLDAGRIDKQTYDRKIAKETAPTEKNYKQFQLQAAAYADRMANSENILQPFEKLAAEGNFDPVNNTSAALSKVPLAGGYLSNVVLSSEQQQYRNAAEEWIRAKLRKESGASIPDKEMEQEYKTYFPVPGDGAEVIKQKATMRRQNTEIMAKQSAGAYEDTYGGGTEQAPTTTTKPKYSEGQKARWPDGSIKTFTNGKWQ